MFPLGFVAVALGLFIADSVIKKRPVIQSLKDILADPKNFRADNAKLNGTTYAQPAAASFQGQGAAAASNPVVAFALAQVGKKYVWATAGPNTYDCSGLTKAAYATIGINLPHFSTAQSEMGTYVNPNDPSAWESGDLLFPYPGHVALYAGNGYCVEATNPSQGVIYDPVKSKYWRVRRFTYSGSSVKAMQQGYSGQVAHA